MSIFDRLRKVATAAPTETNAPIVKNKSFSFMALPESLAEMQALPEAALDSPFKTTALVMAALCNFENNENDIAGIIDVVLTDENGKEIKNIILIISIIH